MNPLPCSRKRKRKENRLGMNLKSHLTGNLSERRITTERAPSSRLTVTGRHLSADVGQRPVTDGRQRPQTCAWRRSLARSSLLALCTWPWRALSASYRNLGGDIFKGGAGSELETGRKFVAALVSTLSVWWGFVQARWLLLSSHLNTSFISSALLRRSVKPGHGDLIGFIPTYPSDKGPIQKLFFFKRGRSI